jgi:hypothetical protein
MGIRPAKCGPPAQLRLTVSTLASTEWDSVTPVGGSGSNAVPKRLLTAPGAIVLTVAAIAWSCWTLMRAWLDGQERLVE